MEWLIILALAAWAWWQAARIGALTQRLAALEQRLDALISVSPAPQSAAQAAAEPAAAEEPEPLLLVEVVQAEEEPLLLDTPVPTASNDSDSVLLLTEVAPEDLPIPYPPAAATPPPRVVRQRGRRLEQWLAENGLAWLGGGALALGAIFLVSFAAQQAWFTPQVQLICALALGLGLIGASEWARRSARLGAGSTLVAAMLAGAGVVALYATIWGGHALYGLIGPSTAAILLTVCACVLAGLALLHGQALGVLAIVMAMLTPTFASMGQWPPIGLTLYLCFVGAAGFGLAALQRWAWAGAAALLGLYFWFAQAIGADEIRRALALASFAALGGSALAFRRPLPGPDETRLGLSWRVAHASVPAAALGVSSVLLLWAWLAAAAAPLGAVSAPAWVGAMFVALAAASVRARTAPPATFTVAVVSLVLGFIAYVQARYVALGNDFYPFILFASLAIMLAALGAKPHRSGRRLIAATGALGAAVLTALAASTRSEWHSLAAWAALFSGSAILYAAAHLVSRDVNAPKTSAAVSYWAGAAGVLALLGVESAFGANLRAAADAAFAALFAAGYIWRRWSMLSNTALAAAAFAIAHALSADMIGPALANAGGLAFALVIYALSAALLLLASRFMLDAKSGDEFAGEALSASAIIVALIGVFVGLRWLATTTGGALDAFTESTLRALTLLASGLVLAPRPGHRGGLISAWRGHVLMALGLLYVLLAPVLADHPWWGPTPARIVGPPLFDTLALALAAPAALALGAAARLYSHQRIAARIYAACGGALALIWALTETRRLFHGTAMDTAPLGLFEGACYALIFLGGALAIALAGRMRVSATLAAAFTHDLAAITRACAWAGIAVSALVFLIARHPWWGAHIAADTNALETLLAVLAQAVAVVLALYLGRALSHARPLEATRFAAAAAAIMFAWSCGHAAIRWFAQRGYMDDGAPLTSLEGFAHALWPLALVLVGSDITERAPGRDSVRYYVYDLEAIWAAAVWPALAFTALALWALFNPWWGLHPAHIAGLPSAIIALAVFALAAWMSLAGRNVPYVRREDWFSRVALVAAIGHLFVAATLIVRWSNHPADMPSAATTSVEMWTYSAVWALFGAAVFWEGMRRGSAMLRWIGLVLLLITTAKVFLFDMARLNGFVRVLSFLGLGVVLLAIAWAARRSGSGAPPATSAPDASPPPTPAARRERRHDRRRSW
ncbi:MAG: DUF2339 domain-containing protein [Hyphomonadaceae bacterium]|nr:DUF2339 domain-containing protein [Hyphomonadaceae bacterium]